MLFKYLEYNPVKAYLSQKVGEYPYTLMYDILHKTLRTCMKNSFVLQWYDSTNTLLILLDINMTEEEKINLFQKETTAYKTKPKKIGEKL